MKLLVFSDSHGCLSTMEQAALREAPAHILHLGDHLRDAEALRRKRSIPLTAVPGNCDGLSGNPVLIMTHGHLHGVKMNYQRILYAALEAEADLLLFGHTHRPECFYERGLWVMNPGACGKNGTYGVVEITPNGIACQVKTLGN